MDRIVKVVKLSFSELKVEIMSVGNDYSIVIQGGDSPHIGCTVLAVPRLSLTGDGSKSCTSSVINLTGHKDEVICRLIAERICCKKCAVTVCTGGFHVDEIKKDQIQEVIDAAVDVIDQ